MGGLYIKESEQFFGHLARNLNGQQYSEAKTKKMRSYLSDDAAQKRVINTIS